MAFDAGTAIGKYLLDVSQPEQAARQLKALFAGIAADAAKAGKAAPGGGVSAQSTSNTNAHARAVTALRNSEIAAARAAGDHARALKLIEAELGRASQGTVRYNQLLAQQSRAQAALARQGSGLGTVGGLPILPRTVESFGTQALDQIKSGLLGVVGPAALVTAGFAAVGKAIDLTEESFKLKASLDATTASVKSQLTGFRDANQAYDEAIAFGRRYNFTQAETGAILRDSIGTLRNSTASVTELETALLRLQSKDVSKPLSEASRALAELESGDVTSIKELFRVSAKDALAMRDAIVAGGDSVQVLTAYLDRTQTGMQALELRTQGAAGKMAALAVETERFQLALAGQAGGPGEFILDQRIAITANATRVLSGDTKTLTQDMNALAGALNPVATTTNIVSASNEFAITKFNELTGSAIPPTFFSINGLTEAWNGFIGAINSTPGTIPGSGRLKDDLASITREANAAADAVALALGNKPLPHITDRSPSVGGSVGGLGDRLTKAGNIVAAGQRQADREAKRAADEAERLADLRLQNRLIKARDSAAKIKILQEQLAKTTDPIERQQLQNQIDQERLSIDRERLTTARGVATAADKRLAVEESTYDSIQKQRDALLDIEELTIRDRQQDREDSSKLKTAQAIIRALGGRTDARALDLRGRAEDAIALADVQNRKRDFELEQKRATAGGTITDKGKLLQSVPGGVIPAPAPSSSAAAASGAATVPGAQTIILQLVEGGRVLAQTVEPFVMESLMNGINAVKVSKGA